MWWRWGIFIAGYLAMMWPQWHAVRSGILSPKEAAIFEVGYILLGTIWLTVKGNAKKCAS